MLCLEKLTIQIIDAVLPKCSAKCAKGQLRIRKVAVNAGGDLTLRLLLWRGEFLHACNRGSVPKGRIGKDYVGGAHCRTG